MGNRSVKAPPQFFQGHKKHPGVYSEHFLGVMVSAGYSNLNKGLYRWLEDNCNGKLEAGRSEMKNSFNTEWTGGAFCEAVRINNFNCFYL